MYYTIPQNSAAPWKIHLQFTIRSILIKTTMFMKCQLWFSFHQFIVNYLLLFCVKISTPIILHHPHRKLTIQEIPTRYTAIKIFLYLVSHSFPTIPPPSNRNNRVHHHISPYHPELQGNPLQHCIPSAWKTINNVNIWLLQTLFYNKLSPRNLILFFVFCDIYVYENLLYFFVLVLFCIT